MLLPASRPSSSDVLVRPSKLNRGVGLNFFVCDIFGARTRTKLTVQFLTHAPSILSHTQRVNSSLPNRAEGVARFIITYL